MFTIMIQTWKPVPFFSVRNSLLYPPVTSHMIAPFPKSHVMSPDFSLSSSMGKLIWYKSKICCLKHLPCHISPNKHPQRCVIFRGGVF